MDIWCFPLGPFAFQLRLQPSVSRRQICIINREVVPIHNIVLALLHILKRMSEQAGIFHAVFWTLESNTPRRLPLTFSGARVPKIVS